MKFVSFIDYVPANFKKTLFLFSELHKVNKFCSVGVCKPHFVMCIVSGVVDFV